MSSFIFTDNSQIVEREKDAAIERALEIIGQRAERYAKKDCPVDTGRLRNSIIHQREGKETEIIGTNVEYAPYVEYGTSRNRHPQPFIRPAALNHSDEYKQIAESCLRGTM